MENGEVVLDASAILAFINNESGMEVVMPLIESAIINTVTLAEVVTKLSELGMSESAVQDTLAGLGVQVVPFDEGQAFLAGMLRPATRRFGLSLRDRACLALGITLGLPVITSDRNWARVPLDLDVRLIR